MIHYVFPDTWIRHDPIAISKELVEAKSTILALKSMPYQREWVEDLERMELKREIAGTSRIEGADFTDSELETALQETPDELVTRSQRQAHAAMNAYRWISEIPDDRPIDTDLILELHRRIVTGADDDHCVPGVLRTADQNVTFGQPRHRGVPGGDDCSRALSEFVKALQNEFKEHDPLIRALAAHYHFAAMHPFLDGNGRTARALEALLLRRAGLREFCFIAMSNYYYDEKTNYLANLAAVREGGHDLTPFFQFALQGIATQIRRVMGEIQRAVKKALYRNMMFDLFNRLMTKRKRVIAQRQIEILKQLLKADSLASDELYERVRTHYSGLKNPVSAFFRDLAGLAGLEAISWLWVSKDIVLLQADLDWPTIISEDEFLNRLRDLPKAKSNPFL